MSRIWCLLAIYGLLAAGAQAQKKPPVDDGRGMGLTGTVKQLPATGKRYALVVGVDKYEDASVTSLTGAANDARLLADTLVRYAGFPADNVTLLDTGQPAERQPTRGNILRRLSNLKGIVPADGLLLISFAGHGIERNGHAFLLPTDAQINGDIDLLEQTAINVSDAHNQIRRIGVKQVLLMLDACRNDPQAGRAAADNLMSDAYRNGLYFRNQEVTAFATLYATAVGQRAYEYKEKQHGYFTYYLVEALKGGAADKKTGAVTLGGLVRYLQERVPVRVAQDLGGNRVQKPFAIVEGYRADDLILAALDARTVANTQTPLPQFAAPAAVSVAIPESSRAPAVAAVASLAGTTWNGRNTGGPFVVEFLAGGKLRYLVDGIKNGEKHQFVSPGDWQQSGATLQFTVNNYSLWNCKMEDSALQCELNNDDGGKLKINLFKKN